MRLKTENFSSSRDVPIEPIPKNVNVNVNVPEAGTESDGDWGMMMLALFENAHCPARAPQLAAWMGSAHINVQAWCWVLGSRCQVPGARR